jgi:hypothetical protein
MIAVRERTRCDHYAVIGLGAGPACRSHRATLHYYDRSG